MNLEELIKNKKLWIILIVIVLLIILLLPIWSCGCTPDSCNCLNLLEILEGKHMLP